MFNKGAFTYPKKIARYASLFSFLGSMTLATPALADKSSWGGFVDLSLFYGQVEGFSQTPRGGTEGTTSPERPTFDEVGVKHDDFYQIRGGIRYADYTMTLGYTMIRPEGEKTLENDLITHMKFIPAGTLFKANFTYDWYHFTFEKAFSFSQYDVALSPFVEVDYVKYRYEFNASDGQRSSRQFGIPLGRIGAKVAWQAHRYVSFQALGALSLPITNMDIYNGELSAHLHYFDTPTWGFVPYLAIGVLDIDFKDNQPVPNYVTYCAKPYLRAGFVVRF